MQTEFRYQNKTEFAISSSITFLMLWRGYYNYYLENLRRFDGNIRADLRDLAGETDIPFIDAVISNASVWEFYREVNNAKKNSLRKVRIISSSTPSKKASIPTKSHGISLISITMTPIQKYYWANFLRRIFSSSC